MPPDRQATVRGATGSGEEVARTLAALEEHGDEVAMAPDEVGAAVDKVMMAVDEVGMAVDEAGMAVDEPPGRMSEKE